MPVSLEFLRVLMGGLSVFFAHFLGRSVILTSRRRQGKRPLYTWAFRYAVSAGAVCYFAIDRLALVVLILDSILFALGWWDEWRPKHQEDLARRMFGEDE
jgi:hypothetical protein